MNTLLSLLGHYYGVDWAAMCCGVMSSLLVSNHKVRPGLMFGIIACLGGLFVAWISGQTGFVVSNLLLISINVRGVLRGDRRGLAREKIQAVVANDAQPQAEVQPVRVRVN